MIYKVVGCLFLLCGAMLGGMVYSGGVQKLTDAPVWMFYVAALLLCALGVALLLPSKRNKRQAD